MKELATVRNDVVGSLLRPAQLKAARSQYDEGGLSFEQLRQIEDQGIRDAVKHISSGLYDLICNSNHESSKNEISKFSKSLSILGFRRNRQKIMDTRELRDEAGDCLVKKTMFASILRLCSDEARKSLID